MASKTGVQLTRSKDIKGANERASFTMTQFANSIAQRTPLDPVSLAPAIICYWVNKGDTGPKKASEQPLVTMLIVN